MSRKQRHRQPLQEAKLKQHSASGGRRFTAFSILLICLLGAICYSNSLEGPFVFDDINNIEENPSVRVTALSPGQLYHAATGGRAPRPVAYFSFGLNHYFGGYDVTGYHLVNIAIHLINGMLVYFLALVTYGLFFGGNRGELDVSDRQTIGWLSLFAACLFVAHPLQTQAVTYLVQRMTSMSAMFYLLSLLLYIQGRLKSPGQTRRLLWTGCLVSGILALGCKQIAVTLPAVLLLYEWFFFQNLDRNWATRQIKYLLLMVVFFIASSLLFLTTSPWQRIVMHYSRRDFTLVERVLTQFRVVVDYITLSILPLPARLNLLHNVPTSRSLFDPITTFLSMLTILAILAAAIYLARRQRLVSFCILWFFINLALESSVIALEMIYEHRVYLPMFGVVLMVPYLMHRLLSKQPVVIAVSASLMVVALGYGTYARNQVWQNSISLWSDVIAKDTTFPRGYIERAHAYRLAGKLDLAIPEYSQAIELGANDAETHNHRGTVYGQMGKIDKAMADFNRAIELEPDDPLGYTKRGHIYRLTGRAQQAISDYSKAIDLQSDYIIAYNNRGAVFQRIGKDEQALSDYSKAIELQPGFAPAYNNRANVYAKIGEFDKAVDDYSKAIELAPDFAPALTNRGQAYQKLGKYQLAINDCHQAIKLQPGMMPAYESLAWLLSSSPDSAQRDGKQAIQHAKRACQLSNWQNSETLEALAAAYAESGDFSESIKWQTKALQLASPELAPTARQRLELYQARQPYHLRPQSDAGDEPRDGE